MKHLFPQAAGTMRRAAAMVEGWYDPPLGPDAKPLEIREAVIEDIEQHTEPAGAGRRVLPYRHVGVVIRAASKPDRARLRAGLDGLHEAVCTRLAEIQCAIPRGLSLQVRFVTRALTGWVADQRMAVEYADAADDAPAIASPTGLPTLRVSIVRGQAAQSSYVLRDARVRIGRGESPVDGRGRARINQIAFLEDGDAHTRTVGRAHASIHYDAVRHEYRLFDDGSRNGTRLVRSGMTVDIVPRDAVGVVIRPGDEIRIGTAALTVKFESR